MKKAMEFFIVVTPGLEAVCAAEAAALGLPETRQCEGGVTFQGGLRELYLANLWLRSATRVLVRAGEFKATDFPDLFRKTVRLPWGSFIRPNTAVQVRAASRRSRLIHTGRIAETVSASIDRALGGNGSGHAGSGEGQLVMVRFEDDHCVLSVDSSGELLHRRGYRCEAGAAPLRENLAAAMLLLLGWDGSIPLADPMCGSGTIPIEAALLAAKRPPGRHRNFAFMDWPGFRPGLWEVLLAEADRQAIIPSVAIFGSDGDAEVLRAARTNAERAGVADLIHFAASRIEALPLHAGSGLVMCNPPYGIRLEEGTDVSALYRLIGLGCRQAFPEWSAALLAVDEQLARDTRLPLRRVAAFSNGGIPVGVYAT